MWQGDARPSRGELDAVRELFAGAAEEYLATVDRRPVLAPGADAAARSFREPLPEAGVGAEEALETLWDRGQGAMATTSGPRYYHWVTGGSTPAAMGADWLTGLTDQQGYAWLGSPLAVELELVTLDWLKELFGLRDGMVGITTTGASMANFVGLAAARQWWGERHGADVSEDGLAGLPRMPVLSGGYIHASAVKVLSMLGVGRSAIERHTRDGAGRVDLDSMERALARLDGAPAVIVAVAGEVNAGDFDPLGALADLAEAYGAWLHVDGAFGLFAAISPRTEHLVRGVERADSVTVDGHKWLNVPYDTGFGFVRDRTLLAKAFAYSARYLSDPDDPHPNMGGLGPESSRRARSLAVWATLKAYGRSGYRRLVEHHLDLAQRMAERVRATPDLELLAEVPLNVVLFRWNPGGLGEAELNEANDRLARLIQEDGRFSVGATQHGSAIALRPTIVNWRTEAADVDAFVSTAAELAAGLASPSAA